MNVTIKISVGVETDTIDPIKVQQSQFTSW